MWDLAPFNQCHALAMLGPGVKATVREGRAREEEEEEVEPGFIAQGFSSNIARAFSMKRQ